MENNTITLKINSKQFKEIPMERTYKQELDLAVKNNIDIYKLKISYEVNYFLVNGYWWLESNYDDYEVMEMFEDICNIVSEVWLSLDNNYSLSNIVEAVINLLFECNTDIEDIDKYMVIGYIQDNF